MMGGGVDYTSVRVAPDLQPQPDCAHPGARCLRLLFTDLGHPAVPAVAEVLRRGCRRAHLTGRSTRHPLPPPPPGISMIVDGRSGWNDPVEALDDAASEGGCDTVLPMTPADVRTLTSTAMRERAGSDGIYLVCPPDPMINLVRSRWQLAQHLRDLNLPVVPTLRVSRGGDLLTAATELGYPDTDLTVVPDDVFADAAWTVSADADLTDPDRRLPLPAVTALLDHDPHREPGTSADTVVVRPAPGADAHPDDPHAGRCTVDVVADNGRILAVLARRPGPPRIGTANAGSRGTAGVAGTDTVVTLPGPARELLTAAVTGLRWTGPATVGLAGSSHGGTPVITEVLPWLDPAAYLGAYAGADVLTAAVRHARHEPVPPDPVWEPTPMTSHRYHLLQHWAHLGTQLTDLGVPVSGGVIDRSGVRVTPALDPAPACRHPGIPCLRVLLTDLRHPAVPLIADVLHRTCPAAYLTGGSFEDPLPPAPPGIAGVIDDRADPPMSRAGLLDLADAHGCDTIMPFSLHDAHWLNELRNGYDSTGLHFVCPPDAGFADTYNRWQLYENLRDAGLPTVPTWHVEHADDLRTLAAELGYPDTDLIVALDDVFEDSGTWTVTERASLTDPDRRVPLAAMTTMLEHGLHHSLMSGGTVVRPAASTHPRGDTRDAGRCTVDVVADNGRILTVLARQPDDANGASGINDGRIAATDTVITLPAPARELITNLTEHLDWTGPATITLTGITTTPAVDAVLPWLHPGAYLGTHAGADIITTAVRHARGETDSRTTPNWTPAPVTAHRYDLVQHWPTLPPSPGAAAPPPDRTTPAPTAAGP